MTCDEMAQPAITASVSSYKLRRKIIKKKCKTTCNICGISADKLICSCKNKSILRALPVNKCYNFTIKFIKVTKSLLIARLTGRLNTKNY